MSNQSQNRSKRIPTVSENRLDSNQSVSAIGYSKEEQQAQSFIKGKEPVQPLTLRLPISIYSKLREIAFKQEEKITHVIIRSIKEHIKKIEKREKKNTCESHQETKTP